MREDTTPHVRHDRGIYSDYYTGTRADLIATGLAKPEWIPSVPVLSKSGKQKRRFHLVDPDYDAPVRVWDLAPRGKVWRGLWRVEIPREPELERFANQPAPRRPHLRLVVDNDPRRGT